MVCAGRRRRHEHWRLLVLGQDRAAHVPRAGSQARPGARVVCDGSRPRGARPSADADGLHHPEEAPNAFATGRNPRNGVVAVTEGLVRILDRREVAAVIAHELGHIKHRDTLIMAIAATFAGALSMLANAAMFGSLFGGSQSSEDEEGGSPVAGLLGVLIAPIAATLVQMSISRAREFMADEAAARYTGTPLALASALRKIEAWSHEIPMQAGSPATAHLFIHNPFSVEGLASLFSTHPTTPEILPRPSPCPLPRGERVSIWK